MASERKVVAQKVLDHLNTWPEKPVNFELEDLDKYPIAMMMQQLAGKTQEKKFVNGTKIVSWPFAIFVRVQANANNSKISAISLLNELDEWLADTELPELGDDREAQKFEMTALPSLAGTYDNGTQDYQAVFSLTYKEKG